jgi:uncharacterized protein (DUF433 family)
MHQHPASIQLRFKHAADRRNRTWVRASIREVLARREEAKRFPPPLPFSEILTEAVKKCSSISMDPRRMQGSPCIAGTRIPVHLVLWAVEQHGSIDGALKSYPDLTTQQVKDALYFGEVVLGSNRVNTEAAPTS